MAVTQWLYCYNHVRPHEALGWMTPIEKRAENLGVEFNQAGEPDTLECYARSPAAGPRWGLT